MNYLQKLQLGLQIAAQIQAARAAILAAVPGQSVDAGVVKGIRVWGRLLDLPLKPMVR